MDDLKLFQNEANLIDRILNGKSTDELEGINFSKEDIERYKNLESYLPYVIYNECCGPYVINRIDLEPIVEKIANMSKKTNHEHATLIFTDSRSADNIKTTKKLYLPDEIVEGTNFCVSLEPLLKRYSYKNVIGFIHSHPMMHDYPSTNDFHDLQISGQTFKIYIVGIVLPNKSKRVSFYKIKVPFIDEFYKKYCNGIYLFVQPKKEVVERYWLRENVPLI
jgi:proteasome lid subunit RPN8/RPN11